MLLVSYSLCGMLMWHSIYNHINNSKVNGNLFMGKKNLQDLKILISITSANLSTYTQGR